MSRVAKRQPYSWQALYPANFLDQVITVSSKTAIGGTTVLRLLREAELFPNCRYLSGGDINRKLATEHGFPSIEAFARHKAEHPEVDFDQKCDSLITEAGGINGVVIEGRLPHVFVPKGFHVLLVCPVELRARRRVSVEKGIPLEAVTAEEIAAMAVKIQTRDNDDDRNYKLRYPGSAWAKTHFDLVLDTSKVPQDKMVKRIMSSHARWVKEKARSGRLVFTQLHKAV